MACSAGAARSPTPPGPVDVGTWCGNVTERACQVAHDRCAVQMDTLTSCTHAARPACVGQREPTHPSGRSGPDLDRCLTSIDAIDCKHILDPAAYQLCVLPPS
jgi:hypothetical protein